MACSACRTGTGRQRKVGQAALREFLERTQSAGRSFLEVTQEAEEQHKANRDKAKQELDPVERALSDHEPHLVCQYCVRQLNGVPVTFDQVTEWLDSASSDVLKHITTVLLRAEDLIEETEAAAGGRVGRFARHLIHRDESPPADAAAQLLFLSRRFPNQPFSELAHWGGIHITRRTLSRMAEYAAVCDVHEALENCGPKCRRARASATASGT